MLAESLIEITAYGHREPSIDSSYLDDNCFISPPPDPAQPSPDPNDPDSSGDATGGTDPDPDAPAAPPDAKLSTMHFPVGASITVNLRGRTGNRAKDFTMQVDEA